MAIAHEPPAKLEASGQPSPGSALSAPAIPDYELLRRVGRGAYGEVWLARNLTGSFVAVKVVARAAFDYDRPFEREFEGIKRFEPISRSDPAQVAVLHVGRGDGFFYYVMELADGVENPKAEGRNPKAEIRNPKAEKSGVAGSSDFGTSTLRSSPATEDGSAFGFPSAFGPRPSDFYIPHTLREDLKRHGRLPVTQCVQIGLALTRALAHLHKCGLVHRDVKPSNVIFVGGVPKLADIGLVASVDATRSLVGTEGYVAPEGPGTPQADLYGLGKLLYEISTGCDRKEFPALPPDIATRPDRDALIELNAVVMRACQFDPHQRYGSAEAMLAELALLQEGRSVQQNRRWQRRWLAARRAGLPIALLMVAGLGLSRVLRSNGDEHLRSRKPEVNKLVDSGSLKLQDPGRIDEAIKDFEAAITLEPKSAPAWLGLFEADIHAGGLNWNTPADLRRAIRNAARRLMDTAPDRAESHVASALMKWRDWQFHEALSEARSATAMREISRYGREFAHSIYGFLLLQSARPDEALIEYRNAEKLNGGDALVQHHLGHPYFAKRNFDEALKHYRASIELLPGWYTGHYWIGRVFEEKGDYLAAITEFETRDNLAGENKARTTRFYDDLREAVRQDPANGYWKRRLELASKDFPKDLYYIATLYARRGDKKNAYTYLRNACKRRAFFEGLLFDLCWDHSDEQFKVIARGIGLLE